MAETLTGAPAAAYVSAWMEVGRSGRTVCAARLRADALAAASSGKALARLRLASARVAVRVRPATLAPARPTAGRARAHRPSNRRRTRCKAPGRPGRPRRGS